MTVADLLPGYREVFGHPINLRAMWMDARLNALLCACHPRPSRVPRALWWHAVWFYLPPALLRRLALHVSVWRGFYRRSRA